MLPDVAWGNGDKRPASLLHRPPNNKESLSRAAWNWDSDSNAKAMDRCWAGRSGEHRMSLFGSELDWPPTSALSMMRCLQELCVMTHLGINLKGIP